MLSRTVTFLVTVTVIAFTLQSPVALGQTELTGGTLPPVPPNLQVPTGNTAYLKAHAIGTQNYVCLPGTNGPFWKFLGPQATLFVTFPWLRGEVRWQVSTHFLSSNPQEGGTARPTWQSSLDTSAVWGKAIADSLDPQFVAPGAIPWLLVQVVGAQRGPTGGFALTQTSFIQRVNTSGGVAPSSGCDASAFGQISLMPYSTDYIFYQTSRRK